jgi:hypothetical protein
LVESFLETQWIETWNFQTGETKVEEISLYSKPQKKDENQVGVDEKISKSLYYLHIAMFSKQSWNPISTIYWADVSKNAMLECEDATKEQQEKITNLLGVIIGLQADMYVLLQDIKKSEQLYKESIAKFQVFNSDHQSLRTSVSKLGHLYWHHFKDYKKSEIQFLQVLEIFDHKSFTQIQIHLDFIGALILLSQLYTEMKEEEKSTENFLKASKEFKKIQNIQDERVESFKKNYFSK